MMGFGHVASQRQVLTPSKWNQVSSALKQRPEKVADKAAQFVPLLQWQRDRQPSREFGQQKSAFSPAPVQQAVSVDQRDLGVVNTTSDASISSSDEEFDPKRKPKRHLAVKTQRKEQLWEPIWRCGPDMTLQIQLNLGNRPAQAKASHASMLFRW